MEFDPTEELILDILNRSDISLTILEIAEKANLHRVTASKYLAVLEAKGHVKRRDVGKAKLYSPAENLKLDNLILNRNSGGKNE
ncbi:MAG: winged helix-turn-helix transcriptional regulator [Candidatus Aenigmatarchaeota archaeon]|nr:MAG: winged helix-turn-helix transcriptional regulator [Candidatus Aenigmarchaeota archaeon]